MLGIRAFLSHSSSDKKIVRKIKSELDKNGILTWLDEFQIGIGDSIRREIDTGIASSNFLILFLSKAAISSEWVNREIDSAFVREIESKDTMIIPVVLEECDIPASLKSKKYIDLRKNYTGGIKILIEALTYPRKSVLRAITGRWVGDHGALYLSTIGNLIIGKYDWLDQKAGNIFGYLEKNRIKFNWTWDLNEENGIGIFDLDETHQKLDGGWWFKSDEINPNIEISKLKEFKEFNSWIYKKDSRTNYDGLSSVFEPGYQGGLYSYKRDKVEYENATQLFSKAIDSIKNKEPKLPKKKSTNENKKKKQIRKRT